MATARQRLARGQHGRRDREAAPPTPRVWDDHDYGQNDSGRDFEMKDQNRDLWLDFIGEPEDSERRLQRGTPIH